MPVRITEHQSNPREEQTRKNNSVDGLLKILGVKVITPEMVQELEEFALDHHTPTFRRIAAYIADYARVNLVGAYAQPAEQNLPAEQTPEAQKNKPPYKT